MRKALVLGFGSPVLSDEGIVPALLKDIERDIDADIDISCELTLSLDLIKHFNNYEFVLIVDTVISNTNRIGEVTVYSIENYEPSLHLENMHDISLPALIDLAKKLGYQLPGKIIIVAINIHDNLTISNRYSAALEERYDDILKQINLLLADQLHPSFQPED